MRNFRSGTGRLVGVLGVTALAIATLAGCGSNGPTGSADQVKAKITADVTQVTQELRSRPPYSDGEITASTTGPAAPSCTNKKRSSAYSLSWTFTSDAYAVSDIYNDFAHRGSGFLDSLGYHWAAESGAMSPTFEGNANNRKFGLHAVLRMTADGSGVGAKVHVEVSATADCR
ncbi:hypothetical protein OG455_40355 [Kitasatospora sp. NBC_01287]|uniref:hypothetical protein n=1 Tax=Kitasatospora sp. NBC_01287 TaxID=2903573 RepID=UPI0022592EB9|nr:hypothetical protein [Kitasatospora sp. NBC_01287]MCX4751690.1 hypothetical protein [Kitasatospora sp. NBC_01287]